MTEPLIIVNNGYLADVTFPFGYSGPVGVSEVEGRVHIAYRSMLAPPVGHELRIGSRLLVVRHVQPAATKLEMTVLTAVDKGVVLDD